MNMTFAAQNSDAIPIYLAAGGSHGVVNSELPANANEWLSANGFSGAVGEVCIIPDSKGGISAACVGTGDADRSSRARFQFADARAKLPAHTYKLATGLDDAAAQEAALGWLLAGYSFERYKARGKKLASLIAPENVNASVLETIAAGEALTRDLINTPTNDMGPDELEKAADDLAREFGATINVRRGDELLKDNLPMIHTVGRASVDAPRLIEMNWGDDGPAITLVGKGVCFDTGGLNIKPGASMGLMKKDMGGAAAVLGLAQMIMSLGLKLRLRVLIPAVENSISGDAYRPGDILTSRKGLTVEINNTDAEGRLVLADALAMADEGGPDLIVSMATLTGAARVAVGPDIAPFYATLESDATALTKAANEVRDPIWRMPFWDPYETMIEPGIADLDNAPKGGFAGSITAALFLRRFVTNCARYVHFDIYGWNPTPAPARPKGGTGQGTRAILQALIEATEG